MAKVTITLEDAPGADGSPGLIVGWDTTDPEDTESLANNWGSDCVNNIAAAGETVTDLSDDAVNKTKNEGMN